MKNIQNLTIDINKKPFQTITANVGEVASRFIRINIVDKSIPMDLTGVAASLYAEKPDGKKVFNNVTIEDKKNGIILAELTSQILAVEGNVKLTLLLIKNNSKLCSKQFLLNVDKSIIDDEALESTNEFRALTTSLSKVNEWNEYFEQTSGQIEEKYTERLNDIKSRVNRAENNFLTISVKDYENMALNDTEMFNLALKNTNCEIIVPSGEYLIENELVMSPSIKLVFQGGAKLKFVNNEAKLCVNYGCILKDISIELPKLYNNSAIEISSRTITKLYQNKADIFIDGCYISIPPSYDGMNNYEGCVFEIYALEEHEHNGFWNIHIQNVTFEGLMKYFCKNYHDKKSWITSCSFKNITVNSCKYGWFGSKDENIILTTDYKDIGALVIENIHYQCNTTKHICYFTGGQKRLKNMINWDWIVSTPQYCLSQNLAFNENNRIIVDSFLTDITNEFKVEGVPNEVSSSMVRRIVATGGNEYLGNRHAKHETEHSSHYRGFGLTANETVPIWFNAKMFIKGNSSTMRGILNIFSDIRHDISLYILKAGGDWYYMHNCNTELIENIELYGKVITNDYGQVLDLYIKFNKNLGAVSFYQTIAKTNWYDEIILTRVSAEPDLSGFSKFISYTKGCYLNELPNTYIPYLSTAGAKNHIAQKNNRVVYRTKNDIQEIIPKFRIGSITTNGGSVNVTFPNLDITDYNVFVNAPIDFSISNKTSTGFTLTSTSSSKNVSWLVIG